MNLRGVLFLLGRLALALAIALLVPAAVARAIGEPLVGDFLFAAACVGVAGLVLERTFRQAKEFPFGRREAFLLVSAAWIAASVAGALPYVLVHGPSFWIDALFESASGFTTTGASVLSDVAAEPRSLLLWRAMTHWIGGMGIIVLGIAILPKLAVGGMQLLGAEAPGPIKEKLTPRIAQTAKYLWGIYAAITGAEVGLLVALGMEPLDAVCHAFATMATGGFSTEGASIAGFASPAIEWTVTFFMVLAGANFALHYHLFRGRPGPMLRDPEFRTYVGVLGGATVLVGADLLLQGHVASPVDALRFAAFQVTSIVTTTGFATADFDAWPHFSRALLFALFFVGGCSGSTGGSVKVVRVRIVLQKLGADLRRLVHPHAVLPVRLGPRAIPDDVVGSVTTFLLLFLFLFAAGGLALAVWGIDLVSAFSASAACLANVGPGFGLVGPMHTYAEFPGPAKLVLVALMIVGRLELYTVLVLLFLRRRA